MTVKVITFLGTSAKETTYEYKGKIYKGNLFQIALRQFLEFDELVVFVTPKARETFKQNLEPLNDPRLKSVDIRNGRTSEGLWDIFNKLVENVNEGDTVIFDITHGLRSTPFLMFLAAAYLRSAKGVEIKAVLYGAFELGQPAPVIDLTEFISLLDWLTATNEFVKTGNAAALAEQLSQTHEPALLPLAKTVQDIAAGLHLLRPKETSAAAATLPKTLSMAHEKLPPPFAILSESVKTNYGRFGITEKSNEIDQLGYELEMINWYHSRGQIVHALSMAREWVISFLCVHFELDTGDKDDRAAMEFLVGGGKMKLDDGTTRESPYLKQWTAVPEYKRLRCLWGGPHELANLRNDVLHSGFRKNPKSSADVITAANKAITELNAIAENLNLKEQAQ